MTRTLEEECLIYAPAKYLTAINKAIMGRNFHDAYIIIQSVAACVYEAAKPKWQKIKDNPPPVDKMVIVKNEEITTFAKYTTHVGSMRSFGWQLPCSCVFYDLDKFTEWREVE